MEKANVGKPFKNSAVKIRRAGRGEDQGRNFQIETLSKPP